MRRPKPPKADIPFLDAVRCVATCCILLFHLQPAVAAFFGPLPCLAYGFLGVDVFFALSGFLIFYHYNDILLPFDGKSYRAFLLHRLIRLYPVHLTVLLLLAAIVSAAPLTDVTINHPDDYTLSTFIAQVLLVSAWDFPAHMSWNFYAWAISALWLAYLLAPVFIFLALKIRNLWVLALSAVVLMSLTPALHTLWPYESMVAYAVPRVVCGFALGTLLCRWMALKDLAFPVFDSAFTRFGARISYAVYMGQFIVVMSFKKALPPEAYAAHPFLYVTAEIGAIILFGVILHYAVEKPARRWLMPRVR